MKLRQNKGESVKAYIKRTLAIKEEVTQNTAASSIINNLDIQKPKIKENPNAETDNRSKR
jgi:hypothetical protein